MKKRQCEFTGCKDTRLKCRVKQLSSLDTMHMCDDYDVCHYLCRNHLGLYVFIQIAIKDTLRKLT